ncbi:hypothetical protein, partial [Alkalibacillus haloalkaliphilus]|uniref:hypothetical protein n=1 Tax=Alkalibacillus haloalkaliphilus TaxID=94136 RepID=UPI0029356EF9
MSDNEQQHQEQDDRVKSEDPNATINIKVCPLPLFICLSRFPWGPFLASVAWDFFSSVGCGFCFG